MSETPLVIALGVNFPEAEMVRIRSLDPRIVLRPVPELYNVFREAIEGERLERLWERLADAEVLIAIGAVTRHHLSRASSLEWLHVGGAGLEGFAESGGFELGIQVTNSSGVNAAPIAEWVVGAITMFAKNLALAERMRVEHRWARWRTYSLMGKTAGIVGMGAIGRETARRLRPFGVRVIGTRRSAQPGDADPDCDILLPQSELHTLLRESDFVVLAVPLTPETQQLIGERELALMKPDALLVNMARGPVVDTEALMSALIAHRIAGAALDVTDPEPLPATHPLWDLDNVLITPHNSGSADGGLERMNAFFIRNIRHYLRDEPLENIVPRDRGY